MANKNQRKQDVFCLLGPTASGKTSLAVELVKCFPFEIVSVDSAQVYRGMDIGTGKPSKANLAIAPHRLLDIRDPLESYSAADFRTDAIGEIWSIVDSGKVPLLVGGTMLYFKVLRDGLADLPRANKQIRRDIETIAAKHGWAEVHDRLAKVDPGAAASIHPNDPQRLQRALEVFLISGKKLTDFYSEEAKNRSDNKNTQPFNLHFFGIQPEARTVLHKAIKDRFNEMLDRGFVAEVERLYTRGDLDEALPAVKSVGYRQIWRYLSGQVDYEQMIQQAVVATRQLAKRQCTWLRNWEGLLEVKDCSDKTRDTILNYVESTSI